MIRGKKNFLPPCHLILGLSIMFKLEESSIPRHAGERCVRTFDDESSKKYELESESSQSEAIKDEINSDNEIQEANDESDSSDSDDGANRFPDTHVKIGGLSTQVSAESNVERTSETVVDAQEEEGAIIHAAPQQMPRKNRVIQKAKGKQGDNKKKQQSQKQEKQETRAENQNDKKSSNQLKRGQKSKLKKIKEKYKDQDEEEKMMRMQILKSAGNKKTDTSKENENEDEEIKEQRNTAQNKPKNQTEKKQIEASGDADAAEDDDAAGDGNDVDMLNSLTGCPHEEDELLFALAVVAPYNTLHNYKYAFLIFSPIANLNCINGLFLSLLS